eukprot:m.123392 g.123392  ORF g.123392 m.123392 type:complete len:255 (-) comp13754_c0_seq4:73-837(-)
MRRSLSLFDPCLKQVHLNNQLWLCSIYICLFVITELTIHEAARKNDALQVRNLLLTSTADGLARCPNDKNQTPLELAVRADAFGVCLELFKYLRLPEDTRALCKAFVEACKYSFTAIQLAIINHLADMYQFDLAGQVLNQYDESGRTLLHYAVMYHQKTSCQDLLSRGADPTLKFINTDSTTKRAQVVAARRVKGQETGQTTTADRRVKVSATSGSAAEDRMKGEAQAEETEPNLMSAIEFADHKKYRHTAYVS